MCHCTSLSILDMVNLDEEIWHRGERWFSCPLKTLAPHCGTGTYLLDMAGRGQSASVVGPNAHQDRKGGDDGRATVHA